MRAVLDWIGNIQWNIDWNVVAAYAFGLVLLYALARILLLPLKLTFRLLGNAVAGIFLLSLFNLVGGFFGARLPLNPVTAVLAGVLGTVGVALLAVLKYLMIA